MTKQRAFSIHLTASAVVVCVFLSLMFFVWYPAPYFDVNSGWQILRILAGVDVILGPLLTLIVFKPGKPSLKFDMSVVVLIQLIALIGGGMVIYQERPAFVVFAVDRFTVVTAGETAFDKLNAPELQRFAGIGPQLAQADPPEDPKLRQELMLAVVMKGEKDLEFRAELYQPYQPNLIQLRARSIDLKKLVAQDAGAQKAIDDFAARSGAPLIDYFYLPLRGKNKDVVMVLSAKDGLPVDTIRIDPWLKDAPKQ